MSVPPPTAAAKPTSTSHDSSDMPPSSSPSSPPLLPTPPLDARWVHAGAQHLDLLPSPITSVSTTYKAFSQEESDKIEDRWDSMSRDDRARVVKDWGAGEGEGAPKDRKNGGPSDRRSSINSTKSNGERHPVDAIPTEEDRPGTEVIQSGEEQTRDSGSEYRDIVARAQREHEDLELVSGVPVSQPPPRLLGAHGGESVGSPRHLVCDGRDKALLVGARRGAREGISVSSKRLSASDVIGRSNHGRHELSTAISLGPAAEEKLKYALPARFGQGLGIIFEDGDKGRLISSGALTYISRAFWSSVRAKPSGTYVYRGFAAARAASGKEKDDATGKRSSSGSRKEKDKRDSKQTTEQVLEGVTKGVEGIVGAARQEMPTGLRDRNAAEEENAPVTAEDREHDMDNRFTINDITINKSIPYVRELTNSVLLDIPLFMSHHRQKMIEAVCIQANKLYRLWLARNPDFEKHGRVHIIGHSLGSALAAHILSNQPTKMPSLSQLPKQVINQTRDKFLFNTSNLFLCGSPLGIFLHLDQAQLMPRKGRERTMYSPQDEALDRAGKFGCLSIDSLYNVFYYTDPIAYQLNAAVDAKIAAQRSPLAITSVTAPFYATVTEGFSTITKYLPTYLGGVATEKKPVRPGAIRLPSGIEMSGPSGEERLEGSRGERRFSALNPHGNVDFYLPSAGVSEYLDMITAHASYWSDPSFAAFLLAETFSTRLDLMRTGMGLAEQIMPEGTTL
ncbi:hypothetical protein EHS25_000483 [Saitozyma podzolica]|uniref:DDHD domain-containing protein n=1 Tax=Saitozyma podzolica TaxID=1890683 RepID=A0A427YWH6_9TREE|nr:hypothetical protein EHS25_000483 [Saitozyma podzolica]